MRSLSCAILVAALVSGCDKDLEITQPSVSRGRPGVNAEYQVVKLPSPSGTLSRGMAINDRGWVAAASILPGVEDQVLAVRVFAGIALYPAEPRRLREIRDSVLVHARRAGPDQVPTHLTFLGMLESALGDTAMALGRADQLERLRDNVPALVIRADVAYRRGRAQEALDFLNRRQGWSWYGYQIGAPLSINPYMRHLQAAVLDQLGRGEEARGWRRSLTEFAVADLVYAGRSAGGGSEIRP